MMPDPFGQSNGIQMTCLCAVAMKLETWSCEVCSVIQFLWVKRVSLLESRSFGRTLWQWSNESAAACQEVVQRLNMVKIRWIFNSYCPGYPHGVGSENFTFMCYLAVSISRDFCDYICVYTHFLILPAWFYFLYYLVQIYLFNFSLSVIGIWFILLIKYLQLCLFAGWPGAKIKVRFFPFTLQSHSWGYTPVILNLGTRWRWIICN
jgi:hypothetical protein